MTKLPPPRIPHSDPPIVKRWGIVAKTLVDVVAMLIIYDLARTNGWDAIVVLPALGAIVGVWSAAVLKGREPRYPASLYPLALIGLPKMIAAVAAAVHRNGVSG